MNIPQEILIFVVEDDPLYRELLQTWLEDDGFQVETFATGADCLAELKESMPAAICLDLGLPDISGIDILRLARERALARLADEGVEVAHGGVEDLLHPWIRRPRHLLDRGVGRGEFVQVSHRGRSSVAVGAILSRAAAGGRHPGGRRGDRVVERDRPEAGACVGEIFDRFIKNLGLV